MSPVFENELWCAVKFGKFLLYDLESDKVIHQVNRAHVRSSASDVLQLYDTYDVNSVSMTPDPNVVATGGDEGLIKLWDKRIISQSSMPIGGFIGHNDGIVSIDSSVTDPAEGMDTVAQICSNSKDQTLKLWDMRKLNTLEEMSQFKNNKSNFDYRCFTVYPYKHQKLENDNSIFTFKGHKVFKTLIRSKFSPKYTGRRYVYTGSACGRVFIYDTKTGEHYDTLNSPQCMMMSSNSCSQISRDVSWYPTEPCLVSTTFAGALNIFNFSLNQQESLSIV